MPETAIIAPVSRIVFTNTKAMPSKVRLMIAAAETMNKITIRTMCIANDLNHNRRAKNRTDARQPVAEQKASHLFAVVFFA